MNVNLPPVSETSKVAASSATSAEAGEEVTQAEGFFAKLAALIKGDTSDVIASDSEGGESDQQGSESTKVLLDQETEIVSDAPSEEKDSQEISDKAQSALASDNPPPVELLSSEDVVLSGGSDQLLMADGHTDKNSKAEKIVSENEALLGRLDDANKALQPKDGNELPQKLRQKSIDEDVNKVITSDERHRQALPLEIEDLGSTTDEKIIESQALIQTLEIPQDAKRFVETENKVLAPTPVTIDDQAGDINAAIINQTVKSELGQELTLSEIEYVKEQLKSQGMSETEIQQVVLAVQAKMTTVKDIDTDGNQQPLTSGKLTQPVPSIKNEAVAVAAGTAATATAIPWGASSAELLSDDPAVQSDMKTKAQPAQLAQSVQHALSSNSQQLPSTQPSLQQVQPSTAIPLPNELVVSQIQNTAVSPAASEHALLKAALGAKATSQLGKFVTGEGSLGEAKETSFAQQLSQVSGQQSLTAQSPIRADQQVAQAPLQLNRDLAGEQVAERVQMMMSKNLKNIDIRLDPPELGRLQIRMSMTGEGATVHFTVANQQARDVLEQSMPRLREMLAQQGLQLGESSVQQQSSGHQQTRNGAENNVANGQGSSNQDFSGEENLEPDINLDLNVATKRDGISYYA
ncbi:flagellar hook-length control protein FliK [Vibrio ostreicida]|uniref:flagellar hook-length control protein FliK n=1 Tax=Vibrio ostreicida TaxID=526588 RepID=UPI000970A24A|nr:flagellar hook-length control protein FliK [Vibrio ostreicida]